VYVQHYKKDWRISISISNILREIERKHTRDREEEEGRKLLWWRTGRGGGGETRVWNCKTEEDLQINIKNKE